MHVVGEKILSRGRMLWYAANPILSRWIRGWRFNNTLDRVVEVPAIWKLYVIAADNMVVFLEKYRQLSLPCA